MTATRWQRLALAAFPPHFRARYGDELAGLVTDQGRGRGVTLDLLRAAAGAWLRPAFTGSADQRRARRLEATTATVWAWWCMAAVAVAVFARAVDDHPVPGLRSWGWVAYRVGAGTFEATCAVVAVGGFAIWLRVVRQAWRAKAHPVLLRALLPAPVVVLWFAGVGLVAVVGRHVTTAPQPVRTDFGPSTPGAWALLLAFGAFTVACVALCSGSTIAALFRAGLPVRLLSATAVTAAAVAAGLLAVAVAAAVCLAEVLIVGGLDSVGVAMAVIPVAFLATASTVTLTSSIRGLRA